MMILCYEKRPFVPILACAKVSRGRKERCHEENGQGGPSPQAPSSKLGRILEARRARSHLAACKPVRKSNDRSPVALVHQAHTPVLDHHGLVDPGATERTVSRGFRAAFLHVLSTPSLRANLSGVDPVDSAGGHGGVYRLLALLRQTIPKRVGTAWTWFGWTVFAVDGSRGDAPRTKRNEKLLGKAGRDKTHPQWWITRLIHLPTKMMWDWRQGPGNSSERTHLREMIPSLPASSLLVADTGFGGFDLLWQLSNAKVMFLIRCGGNTTLLVEDTRQRIERRGECRYVCLWPKNRRRYKPLRLRLIVLKRGGKRVYLLTNVLESPRLSRSMAGELYRARWGIEVEFRGLKQTLARRKVLARTPEVGAMELAANILALALLLLYAAMIMGARVTRLSLADSLRAIRRAMERLRNGKSCATLGEQLLAAVCDEYVRRSSKRARDWPHKKKERPPGGPRLRSPKGSEKARIYAVLTDHDAQLT